MRSSGSSTAGASGVDRAVGRFRGKRSRRARVAVIPLLAGSGTRLKILDAWAAETPVVSTTSVRKDWTEGTGANCLLRDGAAQFADAICELIDSPDLSAKLGKAGRVLYEREYTWNAAWKRLDNVEGLY